MELSRNNFREFAGLSFHIVLFAQLTTENIAVPVGLELLISAQILNAKENIQTFMFLYTLKLPIALSAKAATFILSPAFFEVSPRIDLYRSF